MCGGSVSYQQPNTKTLSETHRLRQMVSLRSYVFRCAPNCFSDFFFYLLGCSLAIHPDKVRVASGQTSGVDKDGKVRLTYE